MKELNTLQQQEFWIIDGKILRDGSLISKESVFVETYLSNTEDVFITTGTRFLEGSFHGFITNAQFLTIKSLIKRPDRKRKKNKKMCLYCYLNKQLAFFVTTLQDLLFYVRN